MRASVIFSTYNSEAWLEKVLIGFSVQSVTDFEIIIADDGSRLATRELIDAMRPKIAMPVYHIWQEDNGFQKSLILNKAILASSTDYLIFTDGDCIPRRDFVETHLKFRQQGHFLSGGYFMLPMETSLAINNDDITSQRCFDVGWLMAHGLKKSSKNLKLTATPWQAGILNRFTPTKASWNGHNASGWKKDILAVNGFNQEMGYGGEDRELGERLTHNGVFGKQIRYSAICLHLEHQRAYATASGQSRNLEIRKYNRKNRITSAENGINTLINGDESADNNQSV